MQETYLTSNEYHRGAISCALLSTHNSPGGRPGAIFCAPTHVVDFHAQPGKRPELTVECTAAAKATNRPSVPLFRATVAKVAENRQLVLYTHDGDRVAWNGVGEGREQSRMLARIDASQLVNGV